MALQHDAGEFVRHGGDWRYGMIVARWVEKGAGQSQRGSRLKEVIDEKVSAASFAQVEEVQLGKTSSNKFATVAGVSNVTVTKYLNAWECAAENGLRAARFGQTHRCAPWFLAPIPLAGHPSFDHPLDVVF
ncbi:hypothetical protein U2G91_17280 [Rhodococcoides fascians]|uniref:hypothetical protein n=1 Tax=Rhodococcoides fascians TaxID=1828 RepID=UPI002ACE45ED|nr:hypothetical protein [Rhodococcus fascians]WQH26834.1 hypothetical protein U2G91_17280 [Rhodococcus fascians]